MRVRTLEIRWHDSKPISTCDFQPIPFKKARPGSDRQFTTQVYRLATGGEDNHVRLWMIHPNIMPPSVLEGASCANDATTARPPRAEYLATLSRHSAAVNVVRFSPNGDLIASAGDDGMVIIWALSTTPPVSSYGSDLSAEDVQYEKEFWKPRTTFRCTTMQIYDLTWSPTGEYILAGGTDNVARIFSSNDGTCLKEIVEHNHYVQGVAWDPMNEYIATQSSDRSMHVHRVSAKGSSLEVHAIGKNTRMPHQHNRTLSSRSRSRHFRRESTAASDAESVTTTTSDAIKDDTTLPISQQPLTPSTPATSSTSMFPPPPVESSSRRSSFSGSNAPSSPSLAGRYGRSPSPMPALPAIRAMPASSAWASVKLYGDESYTNFFRRLTFSPDGGLLLTPAGQFEDPSVIPGLSDQSSRGRNRTAEECPGTSSSVYIYTRANFARPPIAQLPGHKKASVAVRFSPILYELRQGVISFEEPRMIIVEKGKEESLELNLGAGSSAVSAAPISPHKHSIPTPSLSPIVSPSPVFAGMPSSLRMPSPALSATDAIAPPTPGRSVASTPVQQMSTPSIVTSSVFALPYRMLYAVATMDTIAIYDTQQAGPICMLTKLHYDEFTDLTWSPDGQCLILSSRDGYCTIAVFDEILTPHHTQQHTLQLQSIANHNSVPLTYSNTPAATPGPTPSIPSLALPPILSPIVTPTVPLKRRTADSPPPLTPASSVDDNLGGIRPSTSSESQLSASTSVDSVQVEPPKKKRRAALTKVT